MARMARQYNPRAQSLRVFPVYFRFVFYFRFLICVLLFCLRFAFFYLRFLFLFVFDCFLFAFFFLFVFEPSGPPYVNDVPFVGINCIVTVFSWY